ncbi:hypothetical protein [Sphingomonas sp. ID0503]|uniref:hypothetical protein n=1 Tax=Sphingomonas sp. ID0503 TaxID=3399691 RepID=UPI003AFA99D5
MTLDHQEVRGWADGHHHITAALSTLGRQVLDAFLVLERIQFDRPWESRRTCR